MIPIKRAADVSLASPLPISKVKSHKWSLAERGASSLMLYIFTRHKHSLQFQKIAAHTDSACMQKKNNNKKISPTSEDNLVMKKNLKNTSFCRLELDV